MVIKIGGVMAGVTAGFNPNISTGVIPIDPGAISEKRTVVDAALSASGDVKMLKQEAKQVGGGFVDDGSGNVKADVFNNNGRDCYCFTRQLVVDRGPSKPPLVYEYTIFTSVEAKREGTPEADAAKRSALTLASMIGQAGETKMRDALNMPHYGQRDCLNSGFAQHLLRKGATFEFWSPTSDQAVHPHKGKDFTASKVELIKAPDTPVVSWRGFVTDAMVDFSKLDKAEIESRKLLETMKKTTIAADKTLSTVGFTQRPGYTPPAPPSPLAGNPFAPPAPPVVPHDLQNPQQSAAFDPANPNA